MFSLSLVTSERIHMRSSQRSRGTKEWRNVVNLIGDRNGGGKGSEETDQDSGAPISPLI